MAIWSSRWIDRIAAAFVSAAMSGVVSAVMVLTQGGFNRFFLLAWLKGWLLGFVVSFPTAFVVVPMAQRWAATARLRANSAEAGSVGRKF